MEQLGISELEAEEREVLIGLLMMLTNADHNYSPEEADELKRVAAEMGREAFVAAADTARQRFGDQQAILDAAAQIERPGARRLIFELACELSGSDGLAAEESRVLSYLAEQWDFNWS